jgi:hypothetical protein
MPDGNLCQPRRVLFGDPPTMNGSLLHSLKPGGRIAVIDFVPRSGHSAAPGKRDQGADHGILPADVIDELKASGFLDVHEVAWLSPGYFAVVGVRSRCGSSRSDHSHHVVRGLTARIAERLQRPDCTPKEHGHGVCAGTLDDGQPEHTRKALATPIEMVSKDEDRSLTGLRTPAESKGADTLRQRLWPTIVLVLLVAGSQPSGQSSRCSPQT